MEYLAEMRWTGGRNACRKLELPQKKMDRRCWRQATHSRSGSAGRSRLEERREEMKVMFCKRSEVLEERKLVIKKDK